MKLLFEVKGNGWLYSLKKINLYIHKKFDERTEQLALAFFWKMWTNLFTNPEDWKTWSCSVVIDEYIVYE